MPQDNTIYTSDDIEDIILSKNIVYAEGSDFAKTGEKVRVTSVAFTIKYKDGRELEKSYTFGSFLNALNRASINSTWM